MQVDSGELHGAGSQGPELLVQQWRRPAADENTYLRGRPKRVTFQASEVHKRKIGITLFDCPRDNFAIPVQRHDGWQLVPQVTDDTIAVRAVRPQGAASRRRYPSAGTSRGP